MPAVAVGGDLRRDAARGDEESEAGPGAAPFMRRGEEVAWGRGRRRSDGARRPWQRGGVPERVSRSGGRGAALLGWAGPVGEGKS